MIVQKISILIALVLSSLFIPSGKIEIKDLSKKDSAYFNIDSEKNLIKKDGINFQLLDYYRFYILNNKIDSKKETQFLNSLKKSYQRDYLLSLILKKEEKYQDIFALLIPYLARHPDLLYYYDELLFSAQATNQIVILENHINREKQHADFYKDYLQGLIAASRGKNNNAAIYFSKALAPDSANAQVLYRLSYAYRNSGNYDAAFQNLISIKQNGASDEMICDALIAEGSLFFLSGDYKKAESAYDKGFELSKKIGYKINTAKALINLAIIDDLQGKVFPARMKFNNAINLSEEIKDLDILALANSELGVSYSFTNNLIEAKQHYLQSYLLYKKMGNNLRLSFLSENLGKIFSNIFDYSSAIKYYEEGIQYAGDNKRAHALNLRGLADAYSNLSNFSKALNYYKEAQKITSEIKEISLSAEVNIGLGALNFNLGRYSSALEYFRSANQMLEPSSNLYLSADIFYRMGKTYSGIDSLEKAKYHLLNSIELAKSSGDVLTEAIALNDLALIYLKDNQQKKAADFLSLSEKIAMQYGLQFILAENYLTAAEISNKKDDFLNEKNNLLEARNIGEKLREFNLQIESNYRLAKLHEKNNLNAAAESYFVSAINLIEDVSKPLFYEEDVQISYFSGLSSIYSDFGKFYLANNENEKAFEMIDRSRSRNMMQNLSNIKLKSLLKDEKILDKLYEYDWIMHTDIYSDEVRDSISALSLLLKKETVSKNPSAAKYLNFQPEFNLAELQLKLKDRENLLSFFTTDEKSYLFLINKNDLKVFPIPAGKNDIIKMIKEISPYYTSFDSDESSFFNQDLFSFNSKASNLLYQALLKNALNEIEKGEKLIISPSHELLQLPFDFLVTDFNTDQSAYNYADKNYLIYDYDISYTPSASALIEQREKETIGNDKILIVGNPSINNSREEYAERRGLLEESGGIPRNVALLPLKYSAEEISEIDNIISADKILINNDATETNFKLNAEKSSIIHLSTHSFLFNKQPLIFFSNFYDSENDGFLEAGEIVQLKLNSDLIVLSSCNSGLGRTDASEGILGMTKAFFEAGAKSVIVSLWEVNDKYTSKLMTLFYKKLSEGHDKANALRSAKIDFIKEYSPNPYFWSAFILSGDNSEVSIKQNVSGISILWGVLIIIAAAFFLFLLSKKRTYLNSNQ